MEHRRFIDADYTTTTAAPMQLPTRSELHIVFGSHQPSPHQVVSKCAMLSKALSRDRQIRLRCAMPIFVKTLTGKTVTFDVEDQ